MVSLFRKLLSLVILTLSLSLRRLTQNTWSPTRLWNRRVRRHPPPPPSRSPKNGWNRGLELNRNQVRTWGGGWRRALRRKNRWYSEQSGRNPSILWFSPERENRKLLFKKFLTRRTRCEAKQTHRSSVPPPGPDVLFPSPASASRVVTATKRRAASRISSRPGVDAAAQCDWLRRLSIKPALISCFCFVLRELFKGTVHLKSSWTIDETLDWNVKKIKKYIKIIKLFGKIQQNLSILKPWENKPIWKDFIWSKIFTVAAHRGCFPESSAASWKHAA